MRRPAGSADSGTTTQANASAAAPSGTTSRNTPRQPNASISRPPSVGPIAKARPLQLAQMPSTRLRDAGSGQTTRMMASDDGNSSAAPIPVPTRPAISMPTLGAKAQNNDPTVITAAPSANARRRP